MSAAACSTDAFFALRLPQEAGSQPVGNPEQENRSERETEYFAAK
jgi:hypothetical protein